MNMGSLGKKVNLHGDISPIDDLLELSFNGIVSLKWINLIFKFDYIN